jgi:sensor domain CHASE-containing protein
MSLLPPQQTNDPGPGRVAGVGDGWRSRLIAPVVVFLLSLLVGALLVWQAAQQREQQARDRLADVASDHAQAIQRNIERALSATYALAALVRHGNGSVPDFEATAREMLAYYPGAASLQLAPDGVVRHVVPLQGNEKAIGHNLLQDPVRNKEAFLARVSGRLTLAGPFELVQGGLGAVGRLPVFLGEGRRVFWGFTTVLIRFPEVLEDARLGQLDAQGQDYELWRLHPDSGERQVIARSGKTALVDPVDQSLELPNGRWTLSVAPRKGWGDPARSAFDVALALLFSLLLSWVAKLLVDLRREQGRSRDCGLPSAREQLSTSELPVPQHERCRRCLSVGGRHQHGLYPCFRTIGSQVKGFPPEMPCSGTSQWNSCRRRTFRRSARS